MPFLELPGSAPILHERRHREAEAERLETKKQAAIDEAVKAAVATILRRYYGPRSEAFDPRQLLLFEQRVDQLPLDETSIAAEAGDRLASQTPVATESPILRIEELRRPHPCAAMPSAYVLLPTKSS